MQDDVHLTPGERALLAKIAMNIDDPEVRAKVEALAADPNTEPVPAPTASASAPTGPQKPARASRDSAPASDSAVRSVHLHRSITDNAGLTDAVTVLVNGVPLMADEVSRLRHITEIGLEVSSRGDQISEAAQNIASFAQWLFEQVPSDVWETITHWPG